MSRTAWLWRLLSRRLWFRAAAYSLAAVVLALVAPVVAPFIPYELSASIGGSAVDNILGIIASSMLAVTTFSLTAMVSAYSAATSNVTPRAVKLLSEDSASQNALSTFLGGFLFAIVGIIALSTGFYGEQGRVLLFGGTVAVILMIVITLLRWISYLAQLGRVHDTIRRVECAAIDAVRSIAHPPRRAGLATPPLPPGATPLRCDRIGYVTHVDAKALRDCSQASGGRIFLAVLPGMFIDPDRVLAWVDGDAAGISDRVIDAISIDRDRSFDNDPRFGLIVLGEIASRALSPAVNDPGTAISVLGSQLRVLNALAALDRDDLAPVDDQVVMPAIAIEDVATDAFRAIARDGAGTVEVAVRLQKTFAAWARCAPAFADIARRESAEALARAEAALTMESDRDAVRKAAAALTRD